MQRLEVSGAVRPIYGSLLVKRITNDILAFAKLREQVGPHTCAFLYYVNDSTCTLHVYQTLCIATRRANTLRINTFSNPVTSQFMPFLSLCTQCVLSPAAVQRTAATRITGYSDRCCWCSKRYSCQARGYDKGNSPQFCLIS